MHLLDNIQFVIPCVIFIILLILVLRSSLITFTICNIYIKKFKNLKEKGIIQETYCDYFINFFTSNTLYVLWKVMKNKIKLKDLIPKPNNKYQRINGIYTKVRWNQVYDNYLIDSKLKK